MTWLQQDPSGNYHVSFRFGGKKFKRSLKTNKEHKAQVLAARIDDNISLVNRGILAIPPGADIPVFLLSDGKLHERPAIDDPLTLASLFERYFAALPHGNLEQSTIDSMKIHLGHPVRHLGEKARVHDVHRPSKRAFSSN